MNYCDLAFLRNFITIEAADEAKFNLLIGVASRICDNYTGRTLVTNADTTKTFSNKFANVNEVLIGECHDVSTVSVDGEEIDFVALPTERERKLSIYNSDNAFTSGVGHIDVTAKFAKYVDEVPEQIQFATAWVVIGLNNFAIAGGDNDDIKSEKIGDYTVTYKDKEQESNFTTAKGILDSEKLKGRV